MSQSYIGTMPGPKKGTFNNEGKGGKKKAEPLKPKTTKTPMHLQPLGVARCISCGGPRPKGNYPICDTCGRKRK